jgi:hypothetical protein
MEALIDLHGDKFELFGALGARADLCDPRRGECAGSGAWIQETKGITGK